MSRLQRIANLYGFNKEDKGFYTIDYSYDGMNSFIGRIACARPEGPSFSEDELLGKTLTLKDLNAPVKYHFTFAYDVNCTQRPEVVHELIDYDTEITFTDDETKLVYKIFLNDGRICDAYLPVNENMNNVHSPYYYEANGSGVLRVRDLDFFENLTMQGMTSDDEYMLIGFGDNGLLERPSDVFLGEDPDYLDMEALLFEGELDTVGQPSTRLQELIDETKKLPGIGDRMEIIDSLLSKIRTRSVHDILFKDEKKDEKHPMLGAILQDFGHVAFIGNPGTLKTVFVEILYEALKAEGYIKGPLLRVNGREIVQGYVGQTEQAMKKVIDYAIENNAFIFMDEFHALDDTGMGGQGKEYGANAARMLIAAMENHRDEFYVAFAGYPKPMKKAIKNIDPGLKDRISKTYVLEDYTPEQLEEIFYYLMPDRYRLDDDAKAKLTKIIHDGYEDRDDTFGNGRVMRNLVQKVVDAQCLRLHKEGFFDEVLSQRNSNSLTKEFIENSREQATLIKGEDLENIVLDALENIVDAEASGPKQPIGFGIPKKKTEETPNDQDEQTPSGRSVAGVTLSQGRGGALSDADEGFLTGLEDISVNDDAPQKRGARPHQSKLTPRS